MQRTTSTNSPRQPFSSPQRIDILESLGPIVAQMIRNLEVETLAAARRRGTLRGRVRRGQRAASEALDRLEDARLRLAALLA